MICRSHDSVMLRGVAAAALIAAAIGGAQAADMPDDSWLRGTIIDRPAAGVRWDGLYFGGGIGVGNADTDYSKSTYDFINYSLRETALGSENQPQTWDVLPSNLTHGRSYGGFVGYGMQWDELVVGAEVAYNYISGFDSSSSGRLSRIVTNSNGTDTVTITASNSLKLNDYATARLRAGYAFGQFLPYGFAGVAVGRFNYTRNINMVVTGADNGTFTQIDGQNGVIAAGFTGGLGMDVAVLPNVYVRGEWEFVGFAEVKGMRMVTNTGRVAVGVRF